MAQALKRTPDSRLRLQLCNIQEELRGKRLQLYWPEDGAWWPGEVVSLNLRARTATFLYDTGGSVRRLQG